MAESTRGYHDPTVVDEDWREKTKRRSEVKFCDRLKAIYLAEFAKHGKRSLAAAHAGVCADTVNDHLNNDPVFHAAFNAAYDEYRQERARKLERQAMKGFKETIFSPTGEKSTRRRYETQLRVMVLKACEPDLYADKSQVDVTMRGGPMLVPAILVASEWEKQFEQFQQTRELPEATSDDSAIMEGRLEPADAGTRRG